MGKLCGVPDDIADRMAGVLEEDFANAQPMPRAGTPEDIAQLPVAALVLLWRPGAFPMLRDFMERCAVNDWLLHLAPAEGIWGVALVLHGEIGRENEYLRFTSASAPT